MRHSTLVGIATTLANVAFNVSLVIYPEAMRPYAWLVKWLCVGAGLVWFFVLATHPRVLKMFQDGATASPPTPSAAVNININNRPVQNLAGPVNAPLRPPLPQPAAAQVLRRPNIIYTNVTTRYLRMEGERLVEGRPGQEHVRAAVACLRNDPTTAHPMDDAENVRAMVVYQDRDGQEIGNGLPRAAWLNDQYDLVDFRIGDSNCVVLAGEADQGTVAFGHTRRRADLGADVVNSLVLRLPRSVASIQVTLIGENNELLLPQAIVFSYAVENGVPTATRIV